MSLRRAGNEDRRRRMLNDSLANGSLGSTAGAGPWARERSSLGKSINYGDSAFLDEQPRTTEWIPLRLWNYAGLAAVGILAIGALVSLHGLAPQWAAWLKTDRLGSLILGGPGSLSTWFASMTLLAAGVAALVVFSVRRFKLDDYHGHYRVWVWAAVGCFLMSVDATAGLRHLLASVLAAATGTRLVGDGAVWWIVAYGFIAGGIGIRLVLDMRHSRLSTTALGLATGCYAAAVLGRLGWSVGQNAEQRTMLLYGLTLSGHWLLLTAFTLHARYVILDASGLLPPPKHRDEEDEEDEEELHASSTRHSPTISVHPPHGSGNSRSTGTASPPAPWPPRPHQTTSNASSSVSSSGKDPVYPNGPVQRKLTKQEKKVLRDRLERMRREREGG